MAETNIESVSLFDQWIEALTLIVFKHVMRVSLDCSQHHIDDIHPNL